MSENAQWGAVAPPNVREALLESGPSRALIAAALICAAIWSLAVAPFIGNLHTDTLEAIYWGSDWALGYGKHPPVATWLLSLALRLGGPPILSVLLLSQATVLFSAYFVWRAAHLFKGPQAATLAACLYLVSPASTMFAVQVNHNSMLAPFWAASMFFGLRYLKEGRTADAAALGVAAGFGFVTKYEIVFLLVALVAATLAIPEYRRALRRPASYLSVIIFAAILAPHVWWLAMNHWPSVERAVGVDKMTSFSAFGVSAANAFDGQFVLFVGPALLLALRRRAPASKDQAPSRDTFRLGLILVAAPSATLLVGAAMTYQIVKPLWALPLASSVAVGCALIVPLDRTKAGAQMGLLRAAVAVSAATYVGFFAYLLAADAIGKPLMAYDVDAHGLARAVIQEWSTHRPGPPACLVIADRKLGPSPELWIRPQPRVVDYSSPFWHGPKKVADCVKSGAVIVDASPDEQALKTFPGVCPGVRRMAAASMFGLRKTSWPVIVAYAAPAGQSCT